ncbi:alpha/beta hydrolase [Paraburkholderia edwinii]|uniref:Alpha/beta hydrolase n=1 Tax=Paraburkholderia edwinii TaxID=2861782 RepID=A0ABX8UPQ5_9BURK|nr:alpha/beta hydrolase [Paraburkholderia edwinii]
MSVEKQIVPLPSGLKIYVEHHLFDSSFETVLLVNGALATTASFGQTIRYLGERLNALCFDLPYAGQSRQHNVQCTVLTRDDEINILMHLADRFHPAYLLSVSWGGVASLFALARGCKSVRRAAITSFSPFLNEAMIDYITRARDHIAAGENVLASQLLNDTVGRHLPRIMKLCNYRYLTRLPRDELDQVAFHVNQILEMEPERYLAEFARIACDVKFINGDLDEYTTVDDVRRLAAYVHRSEFATIRGAGHFLDLEGRPQQEQMRTVLHDFFRNACETVQIQEASTSTSDALEPIPSLAGTNALPRVSVPAPVQLIAQSPDGSAPDATACLPSAIEARS